MFAESLLETSWAERERRSWTTLTSFGLQAVIIGLLMLIPMLATVGLPSGRTVSTPVSFGHSDPGPTPPARGGGQSGFTPIIPYTGPILRPGSMHYGPPMPGATNSDPVGPPDVGVGLYVGRGPGLPIPMIGTHPVMPVISKPIEKVFRKSEILQGSLIRKVEPKYPPLAIAARIQGPVILEAVISKAGTIENLRLVSGHPMLSGAAIDAVSQWRYRPYILNGDVIEVETQITVNFMLGGGH